MAGLVRKGQQKKGSEMWGEPGEGPDRDSVGQASPARRCRQRELFSVLLFVCFLFFLLLFFGVHSNHRLVGICGVPGADLSCQLALELDELLRGHILQPPRFLSLTPPSLPLMFLFLCIFLFLFVFMFLFLALILAITLTLTFALVLARALSFLLLSTLTLVLLLQLRNTRCRTRQAGVAASEPPVEAAGM